MKLGRNLNYINGKVIRHNNIIPVVSQSISLVDISLYILLESSFNQYLGLAVSSSLEINNIK